MHFAHLAVVLTLIKLLRLFPWTAADWLKTDLLASEPSRGTTQAFCRCTQAPLVETSSPRASAISDATS